VSTRAGHFAVCSALQFGIKVNKVRAIYLGLLALFLKKSSSDGKFL
jgi:hypothetical protein